MSKYSDKKKRQAEGTYVPPVSVAIDISHWDADEVDRLTQENAALRLVIERDKQRVGHLRAEIRNLRGAYAQLSAKYAAVKTRLEVYDRILGALPNGGAKEDEE